MVGIIAKVNLDDNTAIVLDVDKKQYSFSLNECVGFDTHPQVGETVEFGLSNDEVYFVEPETNVDVENIEESTENIDTLKDFDVELSLKIPLDENISDCLENYFEDVITKVYEYEAEFEEGETLDFLQMKRFLNTAYNNLKDMDSTFMDEYLLELRNDLKVLESIYQKFHQKNSAPLIAYEKIFLERQHSYQNYKKRMQKNSAELITLKSTIKSLENKINAAQKEIDNALIAKVIENRKVDLKRYKTYYVNSIHRAGNLRDENIQLKLALESFESKYLDEFLLIYNKESMNYNAFLREQLDGYAYEFDKMMWEQAETSSSIRSFFKKANIEDDYSSKTFLKYFLKSLDDTKYSNEHKRLNSLLEYLENRAKIRVLIVSEDSVEADHIKHLIRSFDKEYSVEKSNQPRAVYYRNGLKKLDIIFVNYSIKNPPIMEFIDMMQKRLKQSGSHAILCVTSHSFKKDHLFKLKEKGIDHILATNLKSEELQLNIKNIIDSLND